MSKRKPDAEEDRVWADSIKCKTARLRREKREAIEKERQAQQDAEQRIAASRAVDMDTIKESILEGLRRRVEKATEDGVSSVEVMIGKNLLESPHLIDVELFRWEIVDLKQWFCEYVQSIGLRTKYFEYFEGITVSWD